MIRDNGAENVAAAWLVLGIAALVGAKYVGLWIFYVFSALTVAGFLYWLASPSD